MLIPLEGAVPFCDELDTVVWKSLSFNKIIVACAFGTATDHHERSIGRCGEVEEIASRAFDLVRDKGGKIFHLLSYQG